jgi:hypothetical protein
VHHADASIAGACPFACPNRHAGCRCGKDHFPLANGLELVAERFKKLSVAAGDLLFFYYTMIQICRNSAAN